MQKIKVRDSFVDLITSRYELTVEAKMRVSRELYFCIRQLVPDYRDLVAAVSGGYASDDGISEKTIVARQIDFYRELLILLGFNPYFDPEWGCRDLTV